MEVNYAGFLIQFVNPLLVEWMLETVGKQYTSVTAHVLRESLGNVLNSVHIACEESRMHVPLDSAEKDDKTERWLVSLGLSEKIMHARMSTCHP